MRRYFQIRLRTAMLLLSACALPCGWLGANLQQWRTERAALAAIGPAATETAGQPYLYLC
jgi:hypothetical protein